MGRLDLWRGSEDGRGENSSSAYYLDGRFAERFASPEAAAFAIHGHNQPILANRAAFAKKYPEHAKLEGKKAAHVAVSDFLSWLRDEKKLTICGHNPTWHHSNYFPTSGNEGDLIAEYLGIDRMAFEKEKRAMLDEMRGKR